MNEPNNPFVGAPAAIAPAPSGPFAQVTHPTPDQAMTGLAGSINQAVAFLASELLVGVDKDVEAAIKDNIAYLMAIQHEMASTRTTGIFGHARNRSALSYLREKEAQLARVLQDIGKAAALRTSITRERQNAILAFITNLLKLVRDAFDVEAAAYAAHAKAADSHAETLAISATIEGRTAAKRLTYDAEAEGQRTIAAQSIHTRATLTASEPRIVTDAKQRAAMGVFTDGFAAAYEAMRLGAIADGMPVEAAARFATKQLTLRVATPVSDDEADQARKQIADLREVATRQSWKR